MVFEVLLSVLIEIRFTRQETIGRFMTGVMILI